MNKKYKCQNSKAHIQRLGWKPKIKTKAQLKIINTYYYIHDIKMYL